MMQEDILIYEVRPHVSKKTGKQMFAFNQGSLFLSYAQLDAAGVENPLTLQNKIMKVEWYDVGEVLLNGTTVTDPKKIVKNFVPEYDAELERQVALDMKKEKLNSWRQVRLRGVGSNTGTIQNPGIAPNLNTGAQSANTGSGAAVVTRNSQMDDQGNPLPGAKLDEQGNVIQTTVEEVVKTADELTAEQFSNK